VQLSKKEEIKKKRERERDKEREREILMELFLQKFCA